MQIGKPAALIFLTFSALTLAGWSGFSSAHQMSDPFLKSSASSEWAQGDDRERPPCSSGILFAGTGTVKSHSSAIPPATKSVPVLLCDWQGFQETGWPQLKPAALELPVDCTPQKFVEQLLIRHGLADWRVHHVLPSAEKIVVRLSNPSPNLHHSVQLYLLTMDALKASLQLHFGHGAEVYFQNDEGGALTFFSYSSGEAGNISWFIDPHTPYPGCREELLQRLAQIPFSPDLTEPWNETPQVGVQEGDAAGQEIARFVCLVLPQSGWDPQTIEFSDPVQADNQFLKRVGFRLVRSIPFYDRNSLSTQEQQYNQLLLPVSAFSRQGDYVPAAHLEQAVELIFGEGTTVEHGGMGDKTWSYQEFTQTYSHFPGGSGDGYGGGLYYSLLNYQERGDTVVATIAMVHYSLFGEAYFGFLPNGSILEFHTELDLDTDTFHYDREGLTSYLCDQAPRARIVLTKKPAGGYLFTEYHYLGFPGKLEGSA